VAGCSLGNGSCVAILLARGWKIKHCI